MTRELADKLSPLPRSLDPLPDESLPGYLLRLAHRLGLAPARIMQLTGLTAGRDGHQPGPPEPDAAPGRGAGRGLRPRHQAHRSRGLATVHEQHVRPVSVGGTAGHRRPVGSPVARQPVGVHLRDPVLPAVPGRRRQLHPAAARRRLAEGMAAAGRVRLPGAPAAAGTPVSRPAGSQPCPQHPERPPG